MIRAAAFFFIMALALGVHATRRGRGARGRGARGRGARGRGDMVEMDGGDMFEMDGGDMFEMGIKSVVKTPIERRDSADYSDDDQDAEPLDGRSSPSPSMLGSGEDGRRVKRSQALTIKTINMVNTSKLVYQPMNEITPSHRAATCTVPSDQNKARERLSLSVSVNRDGSLACKAKAEGDYVGNIDDVIVTLTNAYSKVFAAVQDDSLFIADSEVGRVAQYNNVVYIIYSPPTGKDRKVKEITFATGSNGSHHRINTPKGILLTVYINQDGKRSFGYVGVMDGLNPRKECVLIALSRQGAGFFKRKGYVAYSTASCSRNHALKAGIYMMENNAFKGAAPKFVVMKGTSTLPVYP